MQSNEIKCILTLIARIASNFFHILWRVFFFQGKIFPLFYHVQVGLHEKVKIWTKGIPLFKTEVDFHIHLMLHDSENSDFKIFFAEVY